MAFSTDIVLTAGSILYIQKSGPNRTLPTVTITTSASASIGATSVAITAATSPTILGRSSGQVVIQQGSSLTFNSTTPVTVILADDIKVGDTTATFTVPIIAALQSGNTATSNGLLQIQGADTADFKLSDKTVSTRSLSSGLWDENCKVMLGGQASVSGIYRVADPAFDLVVLPASLATHEVYFKLLLPNKSYRQGYAFIKDFTESVKVDDILKFSFSLSGNGPITYGVDP